MYVGRMRGKTCIYVRVMTQENHPHFPWEEENS